MCFGLTCDQEYICNGQETCNPSDFGTAAPPTGAWQATITDGKLDGWAKILSLKDEGLLHLGIAASNYSGQAGIDCYDCTYNTSTTPLPTGGCRTCFTDTKYNNENLPNQAVESVVGGSGKICSACTDCNLSGIDSKIACQTCQSCKAYGGVVDGSNGAVLGWGWNGNQAPNSEVGAGWVQFNPLNGESGIVYPWLQTVYGTVFSQNSIRQKAALKMTNATYCILAQGIYNFKSGSNCSANVNLQFPTSTSNGDVAYKNALGRLDVVGLTFEVRKTKDISYNKYGNKIITLPGGTVVATPVLLDNSVYVYNGDLTVNSGFSILNGTKENERGNGVIIVNGDLHLAADFDYEADNFDNSNLKKLASVAWIVKGDVIVDPAVSKVVGAFVVLGDGSPCLESSGAACSTNNNYPIYRENGYGLFVSGNSANPLVVSGLIVAKAFSFQRTYADINQGAEKIIYDGRLIANPPPGLTGFTESLPIIRDFEF